MVHGPASSALFGNMQILRLQFSSVAQSCPTLCDPMNHSMPGLPVHHKLPEFTQTHVHRVGVPSSHLILCHPLLLPPVPPSIRVFSSESALHIRWPKYWSFSFSISPSSEHPGLICFRMDWLDLLESKGLSRVFSDLSLTKSEPLVWGPATYSWTSPPVILTHTKVWEPLF